MDKKIKTPESGKGGASPSIEPGFQEITVNVTIVYEIK